MTNETYTLNSIYLKTKKIFNENNIESPETNTVCLIENVLGYNKNQIILNGDEIVEEQKVKTLAKLIKRRINGEPLQYLLGKWDFMGRDFFVGEGVLIPREDTSVLVSHVLQALQGKEQNKKIMLDLCSGTGIIAVTLGLQTPNSTVISMELSKKAFPYLIKNMAFHKAVNVYAINGDVLKDVKKLEQFHQFDVIVSNPPYIKTDEIKTLQKEIMFEPTMALDGGEDGYLFYEQIIKIYTPILKKGGIMAFELGENQYEYVKTLMIQEGYEDITYSLDAGDCKRSILGIKK